MLRSAALSKCSGLVAAASRASAEALWCEAQPCLAWVAANSGGGSSSRRQKGSGSWGSTGFAAGLHSSAPHRQDDSSSTEESLSSVVLEFTADESAVGGALVGLAAASKLGFTGRILGVSGIVGGLVRGDVSAWRLSWLGGLATGAMAMSALHPEGFYHFPETYSLARALCGGLLVGLGTSLGSGCTSGHGVCGIARLAPRSLAATGTFIASGVATAALTGGLAATGVDPAANTTLALMGAPQWQLALPLLGSSLLAVAGLRGLWSAGASQPLVAHMAEFVTGATFAAGLGLSGMLLPSKVVGFLSPFVPAWDPSLAFVMGGALAVTVPAFQYMLRRGTAPLCSATFSLPSNKYVDKPLLAGSAMFGAGWALAGACPGPALVAAIGSPSMHTATLVGSMVVGWALHKRLGPLYDRLLGSRTSLPVAMEQAEQRRGPQM